METLYNYHESNSVGGRPLCNLKFTNHIDLIDGSNGEPQNLTNKLMDRARVYGMEVSTEKSKIMTNS